MRERPNRTAGGRIGYAQIGYLQDSGGGFRHPCAAVDRRRPAKIRRGK
jgi:hypothetical protein